MCSRALAVLSVVVVAVEFASAQVTMSLVGANPHVAKTIVGGVTDLHVLGSTPGTTTSTQTAGVDSAASTLTIGATQAAVGCSYGIEHRLDVVAAPFATVQALATSDLILQFSSATPEPVVLQVTGDLVATGTAITQWMTIDVGVDGIFEWQSQPSTPSYATALTIGPGPTSVRVRAWSQLDGNGSVQATLNVSVTPAHATQIDVVLFGCSVPYHLYAFRTFGGGVELGTFGLPPTGPVLLVFGLGVSPFVLPSAAPSPCIVIPTLDIVALIPSPNGYSLPLPPSVRPVTFQAQAIPILPTGLEATGAYRIQAN